MNKYFPLAKYKKEKMMFMKLLEGCYKVERLYIDSKRLCKQMEPKSQEEYNIARKQIKKTFDEGWTEADCGGRESCILEIPFVFWSSPNKSNCRRQPKRSYGKKLLYIPLNDLKDDIPYPNSSSEAGKVWKPQ
ncbi:hypothetical protein ISN45_At01g024030 [Arabidopsis thaliana x Arabidopsis arenosa]|uniref:DUF220 domain-containing protein n=1 Tax=Arabidopsis thaliana x Arabidopsis arenosa TaxID=1240361 RepID=A0A8T2GJ86_9BRAS|nr:hypothetical protein ISN45_At01g024030 [Arabidopsis thaliana x Arabidopsis arenosa]